MSLEADGQEPNEVLSSAAKEEDCLGSYHTSEMAQLHEYVEF